MHHKRDWNKCNKQLVHRGKIHFWVKRATFKDWKTKRKKKNGRPFLFSNELIKTMSYVRFKYHLSLRETEGFFLSLIERSRQYLKVSGYTQVCRRMKNLQLPQELLDKNT